MSEEIRKPSKEFEVGVYGWFIYANIAFAVIVLIMMRMPTINGLGFFLVIIGIWLPTIIALVDLYTKKKIENAKGVLIAILINTIINGTLSGAFLRIFSGSFPGAILTPILGIFIGFVIQVMEMNSPTAQNLTNLIFR